MDFDGDVMFLESWTGAKGSEVGEVGPGGVCKQSMSTYFYVCFGIMCCYGVPWFLNSTEM